MQESIGEAIEETMERLEKVVGKCSQIARGSSRGGFRAELAEPITRPRPWPNNSSFGSAGLMSAPLKDPSRRHYFFAQPPHESSESIPLTPRETD